MLVDPSGIPDGATVRADVCVVGAGAAGISLARRLRTSGLDVLLLEAGGFEPDAAGQALYDGEMVEPFKRSADDYPRTSRLRYFGGTTNHWAGWCRPLDAHDFSDRPWMGGGWPVSRAELEGPYRVAEKLVGIEPVRDARAWEGSARPPLPLPAGSRLETAFFHFSEPRRFGQAYRGDLVGAERVRLVLDAAVTAFHASPDRTHVERLTVASPGRTWTVEARAFVLATGGLENARMLLVADLGNDHDLVGRYFMDHPGVKGLRAAMSAPSLGLYQERARGTVVACPAMGVVALTPRVQREERLPNGCFLLRSDWEPDALGAGVVAAAGGLARKAVVAVQSSFIAEPIPYAESRVTLLDARDALGLPKIRLHWRLHPDTRASLARAAEIFATELAKAGLGRAHVGAMHDEALPKGLDAGNHHIGTTRMAADPTKGVVDATCRVHGIDNLYVAGSSVFPTAGFANPTLTIVALAVRLADHLQEALS
ncbi:MAG: GMC family oxidoreductase [Alphaproteobacteria bacterium]|nr:GMC family oxidoreductase [Alphaproteobacteria bacterium]